MRSRLAVAGHRDGAGLMGLAAGVRTVSEFDLLIKSCRVRVSESSLSCRIHSGAAAWGMVLTFLFAVLSPCVAHRPLDQASAFFNQTAVG